MRILSLLGIAEKAKGVASGEYQTEKAVKEGRAHLVIVAEDASDNTKKNFSDMCAYYEVPYYEYAEKESLGHCIGKDYRSSLAITNPGIARSLRNYLNIETTE